MGLESATYIFELNPNNPVGATDPKAQGDDHLRMIKGTLLNTFPNIEGVVSASDAELNYLDGATGVTGTGHTVRAIAPALTGTATAETLNASTDLQIGSLSVRHCGARSQSGAGSLAASDKGGIVNVTTAGTQSLGDLEEGFTAVILNSSAGAITIQATDGTLSWMNGLGAPSTGPRTLARGGVCTVTRIAEDDWRIFGTGLS